MKFSLDFDAISTLYYYHNVEFVSIGIFFDRNSWADEASVNKLYRNILLHFHFLSGHFIISANIDV
jgi:hypothetical protein